MNINNRHNKNKKQFVLMISFYLIAGIITCIVFFTNSGYFTRGSFVFYKFDDVPAISESNIEISEVSSSVIGNAGDEEAEIEATQETLEPENVSEDTAEEVTEDKKHYYAFKTINEVQGLRIRTEPSLDASIISKMKPGSVGYVLVLGDEWSYVTDGKHVGYSANEYLELIELDADNLPDDFPKEYRE